MYKRLSLCILLLSASLCGVGDSERQRPESKQPFSLVTLWWQILSSVRPSADCPFPSEMGELPVYGRSEEPPVYHFLCGDGSAVHHRVGQSQVVKNAQGGILTPTPKSSDSSMEDLPVGSPPGEGLLSSFVTGNKGGGCLDPVGYYDPRSSDSARHLNHHEVFP